MTNELPKSSYLYAPGDQSSDWKLPVKDASGKLDLGMMAKAAAALSAKGFRGNRVQMPEDAMAQVKKKLYNFYRQMGRSKAQIPAHLVESKSESEEFTSGEPVVESTGGAVAGVREYEYKGMKGLLVEGYINSLHPDNYQDWCVLTPELKASTEKYFTEGSKVCIEHLLPYRGKSPVTDPVGFTINYEFRDEGIFVQDFIPEPLTASSPEVKRAFEEIKAGEFTSYSVSGFFDRDTGLPKPPGIIFDWQLVEHSLCQKPVDGDAVITNIVEVKATPQGDSGDPQQQPTTEAAPIPAADTIGGPLLMEENEKELLAKLAQEVEAMRAEKAEIEKKAQAEEEARKAEELGRQRAAEIAQQEAERKAQFDAAVEAATKKHLEGFRFPSVGGRYTVPNIITGGTANRSQGSQGSRWRMSGQEPEVKSYVDENGNELPGRIIDWLDAAKRGEIAARFTNLASNPNVQRIEGKTMQMGVPAQSSSPSGSAGGFALPVEYLGDIVPKLVDQSSIRNLCTVLPAEALILEVPKASTAPTRASVVAENTAKPKMTLGLDMVPIRIYTVPMIIDVTNQLLRFSRATAEQMLRDGLADSIRLAEYYYALLGSGTGEPNGIITALKAQAASDNSRFHKLTYRSGTDVTGEAVDTNEQLFDVVTRALNVTENRFYAPDKILVNNNIFWKMQRTKDSLGRYLIDPNTTGDIAQSVWGLPVVKNTLVPQGSMVVGNFKKLHMYVADDLVIDSSSEAGNRWDNNLTGFRAEEMFGLDGSQYIDAFTLVDLTTGGIAAS